MKPRLFFLLLTLTITVAPDVMAQQSQVFPPTNLGACKPGSVLTWAGSGADVTCAGLSDACQAIVNSGTASNYNFYPELVVRNGMYVPSGNWNCKLLSDVVPPSAECTPGDWTEC